MGAINGILMGVYAVVLAACFPSLLTREHTLI